MVSKVKAYGDPKKQQQAYYQAQRDERVSNGTITPAQPNFQPADGSAPRYVAPGKTANEITVRPQDEPNIPARIQQLSQQRQQQIPGGEPNFQPVQGQPQFVPPTGQPQLAQQPQEQQQGTLAAIGEFLRTGQWRGQETPVSKFTGGAQEILGAAPGETPSAFETYSAVLPIPAGVLESVGIRISSKVAAGALSKTEAKWLPKAIQAAFNKAPEFRDITLGRLRTKVGDAKMAEGLKRFSQTTLDNTVSELEAIALGSTIPNTVAKSAAGVVQQGAGVMNTAKAKQIWNAIKLLWGASTSLFTIGFMVQMTSSQAEDVSTDPITSISMASSAANKANWEEGRKRSEELLSELEEWNEDPKKRIPLLGQFAGSDVKRRIGAETIRIQNEAGRIYAENEAGRGRDIKDFQKSRSFAYGDITDLRADAAEEPGLLIELDKLEEELDKVPNEELYAYLVTFEKQMGTLAILVQQAKSARIAESKAEQRAYDATKAAYYEGIEAESRRYDAEQRAYFANQATQDPGRGLDLARAFG